MTFLDHRIPHADIQAEHIRTLFRPTFITIIIAHAITGAFLEPACLACRSLQYGDCSCALHSGL